MPEGIIILFGILAAIIIFFITISIIGNIIFNLKVKKEVSDFFDGNTEKSTVIQRGDLQTLPTPVRKWLEHSGVVGKERISTVRLKQQATMRTKEGQSWMPTQAEQYFTIDEPGFIWKARIKAAPLMYIVGRDKYCHGKGNMLIKFLSLVTVADAKGKEIDQGTLLRYLAEIVWFPTAALSDFITWEAIDTSSAKASINYGGITESGVFEFNELGDVISFAAKRYMELKGKYQMETWLVLMREYKNFNGIRIPCKGEVIWKLKTGDFSWFHFEIKEVEYNRPTIY